MKDNIEGREEEIEFRKALFSIEFIRKAKEKIQEWLNPRVSSVNPHLAYHVPKQGFYTESVEDDSSSDANGVKRGSSIVYTFHLDLSMLMTAMSFMLPRASSLKATDPGGVIFCASQAPLQP